MKIIIGLGNPGEKYQRTRHNLGFKVIDELASRLGITSLKSKHRSFIGEGKIGDHKVIIAQPQTFMNNSGEVFSFLTKKGIKAEEILVIHDELEKPFNSITFRFGGSAKGHNGLRSIIEKIGQNFWRLRFGIGRPEQREMVGDYVLSPFTADEAIKIAQQNVLNLA